MSRPLAKDHNEFCVALYDRVRESGGNVVCSPSSVRFVLGMALAGALGKTAEEMAEVLRLPLDGEVAHQQLAAFVQGLAGDEESSATAAVSNSLWAQEGLTLLQEFRGRVMDLYRAEIHSVDFASKVDDARRSINEWVATETRGEIQNLLGPEALSALSRLVLVNTVYFKALWGRPFDPEHTRDAPFYRLEGDTVEAPLMRYKDWIGYGAGEGFQAVQLDYEGSDLAMVVLLPNDRDGLPALEDRLRSGAVLWESVIAGRVDVDLSLPRFKIRSDLGLVDMLSELGMPSAFSASEADFSGIDGRRSSEGGQFLSAVVQRAVIEVNEEGTEATAATFTEMLLGAVAGERPPTPVFRADHPFLFALVEKRTGAIHFMGRVVDPTDGAF